MEVAICRTYHARGADRRDCRLPTLAPACQPTPVPVRRLGNCSVHSRGVGSMYPEDDSKKPDNSSVGALLMTVHCISAYRRSPPRRSRSQRPAKASPRVRVVFRYPRVLNIYAVRYALIHISTGAFPPPPDPLPIYRHLCYSPPALPGWVNSRPASWLKSRPARARVRVRQANWRRGKGESPWKEGRASPRFTASRAAISVRVSVKRR